MIDVYYPDSVIAQRWNDVLAVRNDIYNGGYEFVDYQWYKNNMPIEGATSSVLYVEGELDFDAEYSVMLTRVDGVKEMVCAINPTKFDDISVKEDAVVVFTSEVSSEVNVKTSESAQARIWSTTGLLIAEYSLDKGDNVLNVANLQGVYLLEFVFEDGNRIIEQIIF